MLGGGGGCAWEDLVLGEQGGETMRNEGLAGQSPRSPASSVARQGSHGLSGLCFVIDPCPFHVWLQKGGMGAL